VGDSFGALGFGTGALSAGFGALGFGTGALSAGFGALGFGTGESTHIPLLLQVLHNP
jgi:hypothetical protein